MSIAAEYPHLRLVTDPPATPLEGVVVEKPARPSRLESAKDHVVVHRGYLPWIGRGYQRIASQWIDGYHDDWPMMIQTARAELQTATASGEQAEKKALVLERRADYRKHRLIYGGASSAITLASGTGIAVGTFTGGLLADLLMLAGAVLFGAHKGRPGTQMATAIEAPADIQLGGIEATAGGMTIDMLFDDTRPFPVAQADTPQQLAVCVLAAMRKANIPVAEVFDVARHIWGWECTVRVSAGTPEAIIKAAGDLETSFDLGANRLRIQPLKERRACATLRLIQTNPFALAPAAPYREAKSISITDRSRVGTSIGGDPLKVSLAGVMGLVVAASGGGKTGILQSLGEITTACFDNITIDLDPFGDGLEDLHDAVRVTARTTEQIEAVLAFLLVLAKGRARLRRQLGMGNKWTPSPEHPAITVFFDEFPKGSELSQLLAVELLLVGRKECIDVVLASQGGTSRYLSENIAQMIAFRAVGPCKRVDTNAVFGDGAAAEGWLPHRLDPATATDPKDAGHVFVQGVPGLTDEPIEYAIHHLDAATLRKLAAERLEAGLLELDQVSIEAMADVDLPEIPGFPKLRSWSALLQLCGAQPPVGQASSHPIVAEALAVMDEHQVGRMRTETLAAAMQLSVDELKAKMRAAGVPDPGPIGAIDGLQNPRGYKRDTLAAA